MKKFQLIIVAMFCLGSIRAQTYIQNVTIVDVIHKKMLPAQTVIISNGIITAVKPDKKVKISQNSQVINGQGKYLIPGMTDSHVHFFSRVAAYIPGLMLLILKNMFHINRRLIGDTTIWKIFFSITFDQE